MTTDFGDYTLDDEPNCPACKSREVGIYAGDYYCLACGYPFAGFQNQTSFSIDDFIGLSGQPVYAKRQEDDVVNNVVSMVGRTRKVKPQPNSSHGHLSGILPDDYEECGDCGFDHIYDFAPAQRWHNDHPDCGCMLTQEDLLTEN